MASSLARRAVLTRIAGRWLALPIEQVVETMRPLPVELLGDAPPCVLGTARIRGEHVQVIDAARLLGVASAEPHAPPRRFVVIRAGASRVALQVDAVLDVRALGDGARCEHVELPQLGAALRDARWIEEPGCP